MSLRVFADELYKSLVYAIVKRLAEEEEQRINRGNCETARLLVRGQLSLRGRWVEADGCRERALVLRNIFVTVTASLPNMFCPTYARSG